MWLSKGDMEQCVAPLVSLITLYEKLDYKLRDTSWLLAMFYKNSLM